MSRSVRFDWERALLASNLSKLARLVGLTLATHADGGGGSIYPGVALLARETGTSERTVVTYLKELRESGWIAQVEQADSRRGRATRYRLTVPSNDDGVHAVQVADAHGASNEVHVVQDEVHDVPANSPIPTHPEQPIQNNPSMPITEGQRPTGRLARQGEGYQLRRRGQL